MYHCSVSAQLIQGEVLPHFGILHPLPPSHLSILPLLIPLKLLPPKQGSPFAQAQVCTGKLSPLSRGVPSLILAGREEHWGHHPECWGHHPECPLPSLRADHEQDRHQGHCHHVGSSRSNISVGFWVCLEGPGHQQVQPAGHCPRRVIGHHTEPRLGCSLSSMKEDPRSLTLVRNHRGSSSSLQESTALAPQKGISLSAPWQGLKLSPF